MACDILDLRCILVNELIGSVTLTVILVTIFYFAFASKMRLGMETTMIFGLIFLLLAGLVIGGLSTIILFASVLTALLMAWMFNKIIGNK